jgi:hypothetical protein
MHNFELEDVLSSDESSCTVWKRAISLFQQADTTDIGGSDLAESSRCIIQEEKKLGL